MAEEFADQPANHLGWVPHFMEFWEEIIAQDQPFAARSAFKRNIVETTRKLRELFDTPLFLDMVNIAHETMSVLLEKSRYTSTPK